MTSGGGLRHGRPALGASTFPIEMEGLASMRARSTSSSLQIQRRDEPARDLQAAMEEMAARNAALEEKHRQETEQTRKEMAVFANMFRSNGMMVPDMAQFQAMVIHSSPHTVASSNGSPMAQTPGAADGAQTPGAADGAAANATPPPSAGRQMDWS